MRGPAIDPGQMAVRLTLETRDDASDGQGGIAAGFAPLASLWALIEPVSARQVERTDSEVFCVTHTIRIRFRADIGTGMRFRKGARVFTVRAFRDPDETRRYLVCDCVEEGR